MLPPGTLEDQTDASELNYLALTLQNVFDVIIDEAVDMKKRKLEIEKKDGNEAAAFQSGCVYAYYRVLHLIKMEMETSSIPLSIFSLDNFNPDKELLDEKL